MGLEDDKILWLFRIGFKYLKEKILKESRKSDSIFLSAVVRRIRFVNELFKKCQQSDSVFISVFMGHIRYKLSGRNIIANNKVIIKGLNNIHTAGMLEIGMSYVGFLHKYDTTFLNIQGDCKFQDNFSIGKGCRFDIGNGATVVFGSGYITAMSTFIIMHRMTIGNGCAISWGCQFLDEDFHSITYDGKKEKNPSIEIGDHVWVGSNVIVLKGTRIPDGCVVASGSVVSSAFEKSNCLIAGNPAKVIKENVEWKKR